MLYPFIQPAMPAVVQVISPQKVTSTTNFLNQGQLARSTLVTTAPEIQASVELENHSLLTAAHSAILLGKPMSVGYAIQPAAGSQGQDFTDGEAQELKLLSADNKSLTAIKIVAAQRGCKARLAVNQGCRNNVLDPNSRKEYQIQVPTQQFPLVAEQTTVEGNLGEVQVRSLQSQILPAQEQQPSTTTPMQTTPVEIRGVVELNADSQEYDSQRQVITASGNVVMRFQEAVLDADRIEVNLKNRLAIAFGNVALRRGQQLLRGERFEYNFGQDTGVISNASGEFFQPTAATDFTVTSPANVGANILPARPLSDRITANQPLQQLTNSGGIGIVVGSDINIPNRPGLQQGGTFNRLRFQAERINFEGNTLQATKVRLTNDPFSPAELEIRADTAQFQRTSSLLSEITTSRPRLVLDQNLEIPLFRNSLTLDRRPREPGLINFGYDQGDRGGLFIERSFEPFTTPTSKFSITPQYFIQKAVQEGGFFDPASFGLRAEVQSTLSPKTTLEGSGFLTSLNFNDVENEFRANVRLRQTIGNTLPHQLTLQYGYRDRLFNGSLGFQPVQSSLGAVVTSPLINLGRDFNASYQAGVQFINAETDKPDLLKPNRDNDRINLSRYQASASVNRGFLLLEGKGLPATATEGLRYTPQPVVPYLKFNTGLTGVLTGYSNGDNQNSISGNLGIDGQIGNFSRPFLDYTGFNITYFQLFPSGESPFLFDRLVDTRVLSAGITQQVYGPFRAGFQTSLNLDNNRAISTDYFLEYSRRTYNILLRYNPVVEIGSISLRVNSFNWVGNPEPFSSDVRPVIQGVTR
ncbi:protein of unknown function DUF1239 [Crinalium epipsammum PCC 9333]|uniref:OstA family protein n=1 Tax=Crinalium epipsammum PCC 9333 TaxID=1173022 RepID=K9W2M6_9CYAN|nr:DUF3769 domain-containing protein [Crinalium epipsammum]AFZ14012.1 protein of unknown function DUF1239 [Crinalium epipsammum PCC 9333]